MLKEKEQAAVDIVHRNGPILPTEVAKALGVDSLLASAILSSLVKNSHILQSKRKIGSSLLYYVKGQEDGVRAKLYKELNDLEIKALERIKKLRIAFEDELYPQERFLLKELLDFAVPVQIKTGDREILCWKYHDVQDEELKSFVESKLKKTKEKPMAEERKEMPTVKPREEKLEMGLKIEKPETNFDGKVLKYLEKIDSQILGKNKIKKTEIDYIVKIPTAIGHQDFFIKALNKKRVSEGDLSKLYVEGTKTNHPMILFIPSKLTKKVQAYLDKHFGNLIRIVVI